MFLRNSLFPGTAWRHLGQEQSGKELACPPGSYLCVFKVFLMRVVPPDTHACGYLEIFHSWDLMSMFLVKSKLPSRKIKVIFGR